jgi:hypothetical protein
MMLAVMQFQGFLAHAMGRQIGGGKGKDGEFEGHWRFSPGWS